MHRISTVATKFRESLRASLTLLLFSTSLAAAAGLAPAGNLDDTAAIMREVAGVDATVIGEIHGTREIPLLFSELVQGHLKAGYFVVVAVEMPQSAIDNVRAATKSGRLDKAQLAKSKFWSLAHDGRTSEAMLDLVKQLSALPQRDVELIGFDGLPQAVGREKSFDLLAAEHLDSRLRARSDANKPRVSKLVVLAGRYHAAPRDDRENLTDYLIALNRHVLPLIVTSASGTAWVCRDGKCGKGEVWDANLHAECKSIALPNAAKQQRAGEICMRAVSASPPALSGGK